MEKPESRKVPPPRQAIRLTLGPKLIGLNAMLLFLCLSGMLSVARETPKGALACALLTGIAFLVGYMNALELSGRVKFDVEKAVDAPGVPAVVLTPVAILPPLPPPSPTPALDDAWFVMMGGEPVGPLSGTELEDGLRNGEIDTLSPVSLSASGPWAPACLHPRFKSAQGPKRLTA